MQIFLFKKGYGKSLWLMHGMFRANGGCGYVKKPDFLTKEDPSGQLFDPKRPLPVKTTLKVGTLILSLKITTTYSFSSIINQS